MSNTQYTVGTTVFAKDTSSIPVIQYISGPRTFTKEMYIAADFSTNTNPYITFSLGEGWTTIDANAFTGQNLRSIHIPASVTSIGDNAFSGLTALTSVTFADIENSNLTTIGNGAFRSTGISSIIIPASVETIGDEAFYLCGALSEVTFFGLQSNLSTIGNNIFITNGSAFTFTAPLSVRELFNVNVGGSQTVGGMNGVTVIDPAALVLANFNTIANVVKNATAFTDKLQSMGISSEGIEAGDAVEVTTDPNVDYRSTINIPSKTLDDITDKPGLIATVTTLFAATYGVAKHRLFVTLSAGSVVINIDILADGYYTPTCFPAGTPIQTDQGVTAIDQLVPGEHTLRGKSIIAITQTRPLQKHIVCFEKDSIGKNVPSQQTLCSKEHKVLYQGEMIKARDLADMCKNVKKVSYNGETLYNVLLEKHGKMLVNNMICETLHPENIAAKFAKSKNSPSKRAIA